MKLKFLFTQILVITFISLNAQSDSERIKQLDAYIQNGIELWKPPGFAVTVVKDGDIIYKKGYGVTTIGTNKKVDENTLFGCMSTTKAFVAAGLAMLIDDGKLNWDDKVINYLPEFQLKDPYLTREITIRDLLTHRTGLGNTDYLWSMMTISSDSALYKMREVDASYSLRSSFIYQNLMYLAAGKVLEEVSGKSWGEFLKERIFLPLEMHDTYSLLEQVKPIENKADAHYEIDGKIIKIDQMSADNIGPAGSMWSSINDIGKWIQFLLNKGVKDGKHLISSVNFQELFKPQQIVPANQFYPTQQITKPNWTTYGLGWFQHDYRGKMVQFHTGSLAGMVAIAGIIPEENIGVYVMGNLDHVELRHAVMYTVFDLFMDGKITKDWSKELYALYHPDSEIKKEPEPIKNTKPSFETTALLGTYTNAQYGSIEILKKGNQLVFNLNNTFLGTMNHWHYDTYKGVFDKKEYGTAMVSFVRGADGKLNYLEVFGEQFYVSK
ncbi:MAG: serine hydrolase [Flavobacteriaceae bacterium]|nr:serine hydrolase [Flavobacteriaceae bacterium]